MKRSRNTIRSRNPTESMPETESAADSEYRKSRFKEIDESNNNHNIISNKVKAAKQMNSIEATDGIDPMSQQWQPKVVLDRLPEKSTIKMLCPAVEIAIPTKKLMKNSGKISIEKTVVNSFAEISPIKFDKDESFVTEYSPDTANDMFSKRLKTIRDMMIMKKPNISAPQKRKRLLKKPNQELVDYEETRKKLHERGEKKELLNGGVRKLYTHGDSFEESENESL